MLLGLAFLEFRLGWRYRLRSSSVPLAMYSLCWKSATEKGTSNLLGFRLVHLHLTPCIRLFDISIIPLYVLRQQATYVIRVAL